SGSAEHQIHSGVENGLARIPSLNHDTNVGSAILDKVVRRENRDEKRALSFSQPNDASISMRITK
ncbi:MAG TPA: hypothetical protein VK731_11290, partial [Candidatus Cybelea sp.]|nr:hypothetical protein [Candidatus Cybelea sp.]